MHLSSPPYVHLILLEFITLITSDEGYSLPLPCYVKISSSLFVLTASQTTQTQYVDRKQNVLMLKLMVQTAT